MISSAGLPFNLAALQEQVSGLEGSEKADGEAFLAALLQLSENQGQPITPAAVLGLLKDQGGKTLPELEELLPSLDGDTLESLAAELPDEVVAGDPSAVLAMLVASGRDSAAALTDEGLALRSGRGMDMQMLSQLRQQPAATPLEGADAFGQIVHSALSAVRHEMPSAAHVPEMTIATPVQHPNWGQAVGERLVWAVRQDISQARIRLDPPHLGPLEISIDVQDDQTRVSIAAHHAVTRDTLEAELPRLRLMLADAGFASVDVNVSQQQEERHAGAQAGGARGGFAEPMAGEEQELPVQRQGLGLVDHYA